MLLVRSACLDKAMGQGSLILRAGKCAMFLREETSAFDVTGPRRGGKKRGANQVDDSKEESVQVCF